MTTFDDLIRYCLTYLGNDATSAPASKRIVLSAYRNIANSFEWNYYKRFRRLNTVAYQHTGSVQYVHTGGSAERLLTITGNTWPSWADLGFVRISNIQYDVDKRIDNTKLTLTENSNPGVDLPAGTQYEIMQDAFILPDDFQSIMHIEWSNQLHCPSYLNPTEFSNQVGLNLGPGQPTYYTIIGDRRRKGKRALRYWPAPDAVYQSNLFYQSRGRPLAIQEETEGLVSIALNSTTVTGDGTAFTADMVGSVIRLSQDSAEVSEIPTGLDDLYPYAMERTITGWTNATAIEVDAAATQTVSQVKYMLSDPADINENGMLNLLYREIDKQCRMHKRMKATEEELNEYRMAQILAFEADSTYSGPRMAHGPSVRPRQFTDYPVNVNP
jgi:hypothetical protein